MKTENGEAIDLAALQSDLGRLADQMKAAGDELRKRQETFDAIKADLKALQSLRNFLVHGNPQSRVDYPASAPAASSGPNVRGRPRGGKRDAILAMLADGQELHTSAIRTLLVEANEMDSDQKSYHTLQVTLSQMARAGELERTARGVYRIAPLPDEAFQN